MIRMNDRRVLVSDSSLSFYTENNLVCENISLLLLLFSILSYIHSVCFYVKQLVHVISLLFIAIIIINSDNF